MHISRFILCLAALAGLLACTAKADARANPSANLAGCDMLSLDMADSVSRWQTVNDGVMGGRSSGGYDFEDGHLVFSGVINTNGGGFSSIRRRMKPGSLSDAKGLALRIKPDDRDYKLTVRTSQRYRGRSVSWQAPIPDSPTGEWSEVRVSFDALEPSVFGRSVPVTGFDRTDIREIGLIISDGEDGPFTLHVDHIDCY